MARVTFKEAARFWVKLGFINFGGPAGQIAIMHDELVERKRWISDGRFLHALNYCMLLPGPEAQQLAIYIGWLLHGVPGGIFAGVFFVLPAVFLMMGLAWSFAVHGDIDWVAALFYGIRAAVVAIVLVALIRVAQKALRSNLHWYTAGAAFVALFLFRVPFPFVIFGAGTLGFFMSDRFSFQTHGDEGVPAEDHMREGDTGLLRAAKVLAIGLTVWIAPLAAVAVWRGTDDILSQEALFFSQAATVTFGGAYAVLSYIGQAATERGWILPGQLVTGLGLAESTPGPLIMVTQFVGFLGAYRNPGGLDPVVAGVLGGLVTVWATFAPCFLWIFLGAPYIEKLRGNQKLSAALGAITAAVVGVIANLAVFFAIHVLFTNTVQLRGIDFPDVTEPDIVAILIAAAAYVAMRHFKISVPLIVLGSAALGFLFRLAVPA